MVDWVRPWILRRGRYDTSARLWEELADEDPLSYKNHLRLTADKFQELLSTVEGFISKQDTTMRMAIPRRTKLEISTSS
jgi:hypothetical protein